MTLEDTLRQIVREELAAIRDELKGLAANKDSTSELVYLTTEQAAKIAQVNTDTIRDWVKEKRLRRYGQGRLRIKATDLYAYLDRLNVAPTSQDEIAARVNRAALRLLK